MDPFPPKYQREARWFPELRLFPDEQSLALALRQMRRRILLLPRFWAALLAGWAATALLAIVLSGALRQLGLGGGAVYGGLAGALGAAALIPAGLAVRGRQREFLRGRLRELGVPVCRECGCAVARQALACPHCSAATS